MAKPADRRQSPRRPFKAPIQVRTDHGEIWRGVARDLSDRGIGAVVYAELRVGESVLLKYLLPDVAAAEPTTRQACVRSRHGWRYGFEFQDALPEGTHAVRGS